MKPIDATSDSYAEYNEDFNEEKLVTMLEFQIQRNFC